MENRSRETAVDGKPKTPTQSNHKNNYSALKQEALLSPAPAQMDLETSCLVKQASHKRTDTAHLRFHEVTGVPTIMETERRMVHARGWGGRDRDLLIGGEFQVCKRREFWSSLAHDVNTTVS